MIKPNMCAVFIGIKGMVHLTQNMTSGDDFGPPG